MSSEATICADVRPAIDVIQYIRHGWPLQRESGFDWSVFYHQHKLHANCCGVGAWIQRARMRERVPQLRFLWRGHRF